MGGKCVFLYTQWGLHPVKNSASWFIANLKGKNVSLKAVVSNSAVGHMLCTVHMCSGVAFYILHLVLLWRVWCRCDSLHIRTFWSEKHVSGMRKKNIISSKFLKRTASWNYGQRHAVLEQKNTWNPSNLWDLWCMVKTYCRLSLLAQESVTASPLFFDILSGTVALLLLSLPCHFLVPPVELKCSTKV